MRRAFLGRIVLCATFVAISCSTPSGTRTGSSATVEKPGGEEISLLAVGDVNLGRRCGQLLLREGPHYPFGHLRTWIRSFDLAFCNLESNISDQGGETVKPDNNLIFTAPPVAAAALRLGGWNLVSTANNHSADYGLRALKETVLRLNAAGIPFNGTALFSSDLYQPTYVKIRELTIAFIAVTAVSNAPVRGTPLEQHLNLADPECVLPALQAAEKNADFTILSYHGGNEYWDSPTNETRQFLRWAVENGADLVLGHHPHVIQGVEHYKKGLILYSLGNFTFYQGGQPYWTDYGVAAAITLGRNGIRKTEFIPIRAHYQPQLILEEDIRARVLGRLMLLTERIKDRGIKG